MAAANATGEAQTGPLRLQFDRTVKLAFAVPSISSDGGLLLHRELDDALGLTDLGAGRFADPRVGGTAATGSPGSCASRSSRASPATRTSTTPTGCAATR
jgi:hypothetical protein